MNKTKIINVKRLIRHQIVLALKAASVGDLRNRTFFGNCIQGNLKLLTKLTKIPDAKN